MCFSPTASFATSGLLALVGALCIRSAKNKKLLPFAMIPLIFAAQQACEGFVWITYPWPISYFFAVLFIIFAITWPMWIPYSLYSFEPGKKRRIILWYDTLAGIALSAGGLFMVARHGIDVAIINHSIAYQLTNAYQEIPEYGTWLLWAWYRATVVVPSFISSFKEIRMLGLLLLIADAIAYVFWKTTFTSVWCFFAAGISLWVLYVIKQIHLKRS
jgi:hypothetical protein